MIRKNPSGDLPVIHESAYVDNTAILCGKIVVEENVFIGFNSVLFDCVVGNGSVVRHNSVVEHCEVPENFHIPSTTNVHSNLELSNIKQVSPQASDFSESVLKANHELVKGYKKLQNEF